MEKLFSAGGVVFFGNTVLLLKRISGNWVLPKGGIEHEEKKSEAALREVMEEASVKATLLDALGKTLYNYRNRSSNYKHVQKTVYWFLMSCDDLYCKPLREEGFVEARFINMEKASQFIRFDDEKNILKKAIDIYSEKYYKTK